MPGAMKKQVGTHRFCLLLLEWDRSIPARPGVLLLSDRAEEHQASMPGQPHNSGGSWFAHAAPHRVAVWFISPLALARATGA